MFFKRKLRKRLERLAKKYGLENKVDLHIRTNYGEVSWTLHPFIEHKDSVAPVMPDAFISKVEKLGRKAEKYSRKFNFKVGEPVTMQDIEREQKTWNFLCKIAEIGANY